MTDVGCQMSDDRCCLDVWLFGCSEVYRFGFSDVIKKNHSMRKNIKILFCLMLGVFAVSLNTLFAQPVSVKAKMDSTQMWIGEQTALYFELVQKKNQRVLDRKSVV